MYRLSLRMDKARGREMIHHFNNKQEMLELIGSDLKELNQSMLFDEVTHYIRTDEKHTPKQHMKAIILRDLYKDMESDFPDNLELKIARSTMATPLSKRLSSLAYEMAEELYPKYQTYLNDGK